MNTIPVASSENASYKEAGIYIIYIALLTSVIFSWRAITSIGLPLLIVASFIYNKVSTGSWFNRRLRNPFVLACFLFFLIQLAGLFYTQHPDESTKLLLLKFSMMGIPLAICSSDYLNSRSFPKLMFAYIHILALAMLFCLGKSFYQYCFNNADASIFFYHALVKPVLSHAIQFSIFAFAGLAWLLVTLTKRNYFYNRIVHIGVLCFFFLFIILLSSKLVIIVSLLYTFVVAGLSSGQLKRISKKAFFLILGSLLLIAGLLFFTDNPIQKRYLDITQGSISETFKQEKFDHGQYLNGVQFRLLEWRFVGEILTEQKDWIWGVSLGDAQPMLDKKYADIGLFIGDGQGNRGFLGYNTHNQFLESLLQSGIPGLLAFCWIYFCLIQMMRRRKNYLVSGFVVLLLLYTFNEAYLETQYGMMIAIFMPLFFYYGTETKE